MYCLLRIANKKIIEAMATVGACARGKFFMGQKSRQTKRHQRQV